MDKHSLRYIAFALLLTLSGCLGRTDPWQAPTSNFEREVHASLEGIDYRLRGLRPSDATVETVGVTLAELRRDRDLLRNEFDRMISSRITPTDSAQADFLERLKDLSIRYQAVRLGRFETRWQFEQAVETHFEVLDREVAFLEGTVFLSDVREELGGSIARLHWLRSDVALGVAETAAAPDREFPQFKRELAASIGKLDIMIAHTTMEVYRTVDAKNPIRSLTMWL